MFRHPTAELAIAEEGRLTRCELCRMFVRPIAFRNGHQTSAKCRAGAARWRQRMALEHARSSRSVRFAAGGVDLESVSTFKYLGRPLSATGNDWPALYTNLTKARQRWAMISRILTREGAQPAVSAMFYKAIVQTVLLYGSETWTTTQSMLKILNGFHHRVARRLTGRQPFFSRREQSWIYPATERLLEETGMFTMEVYLQRRVSRLVEHIATRPLWDLCWDAPRRSGSPAGQMFWWDQPMVANVESNEL